MFQVDCTMLPQSVTDFAFDHLKGDVAHSVDTDDIDIDYDTQTVKVDVGNMDDTYTVQEQIQERAYEKINDIEFETKQGYDTGFEVNELHAVKSAVSEVSVTAE